MIHIHKKLQPLFGETLRYIDIFWMVFWLILGHLLSFFVDQNFYLLTPFRAFIFMILLTDLIAGAYINTTPSVMSYYDKHPTLIKYFPVIHIYPLIFMFLFDVSFLMVLIMYVTTTLFAYRTLTLVTYKNVFAWTVIMIGAFLFGLFEDGYSLSFALGMFLYVMKIVKVFSTRHYMACPVNLSKK